MAYFGAQAESHVASCCVAVCSYHFQTSLAKVPGCPLTIVSMHVPGVQDCSPLSASFLQSGDHFIFLGTFIFYPLFFQGPLTLKFPNLNILWDGAQQLLVQSHVSLLIGAFKACHFPQSGCHKNLPPVCTSCRQQATGSSKVKFWTVPSFHTPPQLCAFC